MEAVLSWNANTEEDLLRYQLYYGHISGTYTTVIELSTDTTTTVTGLRDGVPYYFALTAVDTAENESGFSSEVTKINKRINRKWRIGV